MDKIEANKIAWSQLSSDHYQTFKHLLSTNQHQLNHYISKEIGDLKGKRVIHLQCNTGADSLLLAKTAEHVTGVDLVEENIFYANQLAKDLKVSNINFLTSNILELSNVLNDTYDVVFISEGAIGWLPDLDQWAKVIRSLLKDDGYLYLFDSHPFFLMLNEDKLARGILDVTYPYFDKTPDVDNTIGGYASEEKIGFNNYFWLHTMGDIINSLTNAGLHINYLHEFQENFYNSGGMTPTNQTGLYNLAFNESKFPMSFSLKATVHLKH